MSDRYMTQSLFVDIIVPLRVDGVFTYSVPEELNHDVETGKRVLVSFGKKKIYSGIIVSVHEREPNYFTKEIIAILDSKPIVTHHQLLLWEWISRYYMCPIGEIMKIALPTNLKLESETFIVKGQLFANWIAENDNDILLIDALNKNESIHFNELQKKLSRKNIHSHIRKWLKNQYIDLVEDIKEKYTPKRIECIGLSNQINSEDELNLIFKQLEKAPRQTDVLMAYFSLACGEWQNKQLVKKSELLKKSRTNGQALKALLNKGILTSVFIEESRIQASQENYRKELIVLTKEQEQAKEEILGHFIEKSVVLLHGVTGSGKTEIYIKIIEEFLKNNQQVLYLLPEIAITSQMVKRLKSALNVPIFLYHSKIGENERTELYLQILEKNKNPLVILGVRSSLFLPFKNLGLIIIDEEHESTYKQQSPEPHYHARDTAIMLASWFNAKVLLGSATPSLETYYNALSGKYRLVELNTRFKGIEMPEITIIDLRSERKKNRVRMNYYSQRLIDELKQTLEKQKQSIVFQNRRGYAPYLECDACGWIPGCEHCDVKLTYHKAIQKLVCHYCGFSIDIPSVCVECSLPDLKVRGIGTERIEDELAMLFPNAHIGRFDLDTTRTGRKIEELLHNIEQNKINILVGTQMITKGLDFENVELICIIDADAMLNFPDFRTNERTFQLFAQVAGRAGRRQQQGKVLIQSTQPNHPVLYYLKNYDYQGFVEWQLSERKRFHYPPYVRLIKLTLKNKNAEQVKKTSQLLTNILKKEKNIMVIGPQSPIISKIQNFYIMEIWIKLGNIYNNLSNRDRLYQIIQQFFLQPELKSTIYKVDVDPI